MLPVWRALHEYGEATIRIDQHIDMLHNRRCNGSQFAGRFVGLDLGLHLRYSVSIFAKSEELMALAMSLLTPGPPSRFPMRSARISASRHLMVVASIFVSKFLASLRCLALISEMSEILIRVYDVSFSFGKGTQLSVSQGVARTSSLLERRHGLYWPLLR